MPDSKLETRMKRARSVYRDLLLAVKAYRHGARKPLMILKEARRAGIGYPLALALVEQESAFRNIFGCDLGMRKGPPYCHQRVTRERVDKLIKYLVNGGTSNGVGYTQLTWPEYIFNAEILGGAHKPQIQCRVGFAVLAGHIKQYGLENGIARYNGSGPAADLYAQRVLGKRNIWRQRLDLEG